MAGGSLDAVLDDELASELELLDTAGAEELDEEETATLLLDETFESVTQPAINVAVAAARAVYLKKVSTLSLDMTKPALGIK